MPNAPNPTDVQQKDALPARDAMRKDGVVHGLDLPEPLMRDRNQRDFRITRRALEKYGYKEGCIGYQHQRTGLDHRQHTADCRRRLEEAIIVEERYKEMIRRRDERLGRSKDDKAVDFSTVANPSATMPDLENERKAEVEIEIEHSQMHSPMNVDEDVEDGQVEDDKSSSESLSSADSDDSDENNDGNDDNKDLQPKPKSS